MMRVFVLIVLATALTATPVKQPAHHVKSAPAAGRGAKQKRNSADLAANSESVVRVVHGRSSTSRTLKSSSAAVHSRSARRRLKNGRYFRITAPVPSYQLHPDPERYTQIQQALADRGYFKGPVNGVWGDDSVDALKCFQTDGKLEGDGKIDALTLTGLGLGPKHDGSTASTVPLSAATSVPATPSEIPPETNDPQ